MKQFILILIVISMATGCRSKAEIDAGSLDAERRDILLVSHKNILGKCRDGGSGIRAKALAEERDALLALEETTKGTLMAVDIALARQDYNFAHPDGVKWNCWYEGMPRSQQNFDREKEHSRTLLGQIRKWSETEKTRATLPQWLDASKAAEFREVSRIVYWALSESMCEWPEIISEPSSTSLQKFRKLESALEGTAYGYHLEIAKADVDYDHAHTVNECAAPPSEDELVEARKSYEAEIARAVDRLEAIANAQ